MEKRLDIIIHGHPSQGMTYETGLNGVLDIIEMRPGWIVKRDNKREYIYPSTIATDPTLSREMVSLSPVGMGTGKWAGTE